MTKSQGKSKRDRQFNVQQRQRISYIGDVRLSEFADANLVISGHARVKKSTNFLAQARRICTSKDVTAGIIVDEQEALDENEDPDECDVNENGNDNPMQKNKRKISESSDKGKDVQSPKEESDGCVEYPLKIWLLLSEYIQPEDVLSFSLICKTALSVVNTPLFWMHLYKRYYQKAHLPKCLSPHILEIRIGLKQKVVRSLYQFYPPFSSTIANSSLSYESLLGSICLEHWVHHCEEKDSGDVEKWEYNFKMCRKKSKDVYVKRNKALKLTCDDISYNEEEDCRLFKVTCKEYIGLPSVMGMRLRKVTKNKKSTVMRFSSAPLSRASSDMGTVIVTLEHSQKPSLFPWWSPNYWDHAKCCRK